MATSHKRETARRTPRVAVLAGSLAALATGAVVTAGVIGSPEPGGDLVAIDKAAAAAMVTGERSPVISRGGDRSAEGVGTKLDRVLAKESVATAIDAASKRQWTTADLNLWSRPDDKARQLGEIEQGEKVLVTGRSYGERVEIVLDGTSRWVTKGRLSDEEPPSLGGECTNGTSVKSGVSPNVKKVHQAVCANFPEVRVYGTLRGGGGDHPKGKAVDIMISGPRGWEIAEFLREHRVALGVSYVIYEQKIWTVQRGGEGWRSMSNRGSRTANHFDHVHVTTY